MNKQTGYDWALDVITTDFLRWRCRSLRQLAMIVSARRSKRAVKLIVECPKPESFWGMALFAGKL